MSLLIDPRSLGRQLGATSDRQQQAVIKTSLLLLISFPHLLSKRHLPLSNLLMSLPAASLMSQQPTRSLLLQPTQIFFFPLYLILKFLTSASPAPVPGDPSMSCGTTSTYGHSGRQSCLHKQGSLCRMHNQMVLHSTTAPPGQIKAWEERKCRDPSSGSLWEVDVNTQFRRNKVTEDEK